MRYLPHDWKTPEWQYTDKTLDWKNWVGEKTREAWDTFTERQKQILAYDAQSLLDKWEPK